MARPRRIITYPPTGESLTLPAWARRLGLSQQALSARLKKYPPEVALLHGRIDREGTRLLLDDEIGRLRAENEQLRRDVALFCEVAQTLCKTIRRLAGEGL